MDHRIVHLPSDASSPRRKLVEQFGIDFPYHLCVSDLRPYKNQLALVAAYRILVEQYGVPHHLVLVGGNQDLVIEQGIRPDGPAVAANQSRRVITADDLDHMPEMPAAPTEPAGEPHSNVRPMPQRPAPRPPVFGDQPAAGDPPLRAVKPELD